MEMSPDEMAELTKPRGKGDGRILMVGAARKDNVSVPASDQEELCCGTDEEQTPPEEAQFDPNVIADALENLFPKIDGISCIAGEIKRRVQKLTAILRTRDFTEDQIAEAAAPLMLTHRHNRLLLSTVGITLENEITAPTGLRNTGRLETRRKSRTLHSERHEETMTLIREIEAQVKRALCICAPCDDPLFEVYIAEMTERGAVGEKALRLLGERLGGNKMYTDEIVEQLTESSGDQVLSDSIMRAFSEIRKHNAGAKYKLHIGHEPMSRGGRRFYHWLTPAEGESIEADLIPQKLWAARMLTPRKVGERSENLRVITDHPRKTKLLTSEIGAKRGLDMTDYDIVMNRVARPMNHLIHAIERSDNPEDREFSIRRTKRRQGSSFQMEYTLVNRQESIEEWLQEMNIAPGTIRDRVFRKIFEYKLDTEFTMEQLVALLQQDGFATNADRVGEATRRTMKSGKNTWYEISVVKKGPSHTIFVSIKS